MKKLLRITILVFPLSFIANICSAQYYDVHNFGSGADGVNPYGSLIQSGNELYGMTVAGGANNDGNIFCIHPNGTGYRDLYDFTGTTTNGKGPNGSLAISGGVLFGMTQYGGLHNDGVVFSIDTDGTHFKDRWNFDGGGDTNGKQPLGDLIISGGVLYGMTTYGGRHSYGNVFSIDTNGTHYKDRWDFNVGGTTNGTNPWGTLTQIGKTLFGMTYAGGTASYGNIFSIDTNGTNYKDLWNFGAGGGTNGSNPQGNLTVVGAKLYGMTSSGGTHSFGNIFSIDTNGGSYVNRWNFNAPGDTNGSIPNGSLIYAGKAVFGMSSVGGRHSDGNIFSIDTNGTKFTDIEDFTGANGQNPYLSRLLFSASAGTFYGMTENGGTNSLGVVFNDTVIKVRISDTNISCNGSNNGQATAHVTGIVPPFTYSWTGGGTSVRATGLSAGSYTLTVTDYDGLTTTASISITQPAALTIRLASLTNVACYGGSGTAVANAAIGGTLPYAYNWAPSGGTTLTANVTAGTYTITVTDKQGCTAAAIANITQPAALTATSYAVPDDGSHDGLAAVTPGGGTQPYTYLWAPGGQSTDTIKGQGPRSYCCTITDLHGCDTVVCVVVTSDAGINSIASNASQISIYPNPNNGLFKIQSSASGQYTVEIYNVLGEMIKNVGLTGKSNAIDLSAQPEGIYLYRVLSEKGNLIGQGKIVIQK